MSFKKLGRILCGLAMAASISVAAALSGCTIETKHPRAVITIEFNGEEYAIEYTLYRNMYPQTVRHFIELADAGFYDNTIIHDYTSTDWYGGGYDYDADDYASAIKSKDIQGYLNGDYGDTFNKESDYIDLFDSGALTASVYTGYNSDGGDIEVDEDTAYYTLRGEFEANNHTINSGALTASFGTLKMYYTEKVYTDEDDEQNMAKAESMVYVKTSNNETQRLYYDYNSATSLFAIQVSSTTELDEYYYATFAQLRNEDAEDTLNDLLEAIEDYKEGLGSDDFVQTASNVEIDRYDELVKSTTVGYDVPIVPIIIKSVKITKY